MHKTLSVLKEKLQKARRSIMNDPKSFIRHLFYLVTPRFILSHSSICRRINDVIFEFDFHFDSAVKRMYFNCYEEDTVRIMKRILKRGSVFIDVGANIGYLSAIAASLVGKGGQVHSFEPVAQYFQKLKKLSQINPGFQIVANNCAVGEKEEFAKISVTNLGNIGWNTMVRNFMEDGTIREVLEVPVIRLDRYIKEKALRNISLIKIDVEGFEFPVLKGLSGYFENSTERPYIICEIAPTAYHLLGYTLSQLSEFIFRYDYRAHSLIGNLSPIDITNLTGTTDVLFMPVRHFNKND